MTNQDEIERNDRVLAVDGDIIAYRTAAVCEDHFEGACDAIIASTIKDIATDTGISRMRIYLSGERNFRYDIAKTKPYKGNRATMVAPKYLNHCKEYMIKNYRAIRVHGFEADDGIASDMTQNNAIHCGIDKDILQIAGDHYNYVNKEWQHVTEEEALITLYRQILMGDNSDNIPGLPRVGAKTAEKVIEDAASAHEDAIAYYTEICAEKLPDIDPLEYFNEQKMLIEMIHTIDLYSLFTVFVEPETDGFVSQEGDFEGNENKVEPKL